MEEPQEANADFDSPIFSDEDKGKNKSLSEEPLPSIGVVDLDNLKSETLKEIKELGLLDEQGFRSSGNGIIIRKLEKMEKFIDKKVSMKLSFIEKKVEKICEKLGIRLDDY